eukprot:CAMPEP_0194095586 /NCGR_PEP_ID=MMETSP0149-20130528/56902_1 /TAXON_ID=122233 /ORGANISM="Chaetoceros debilis, Strain MM31A-1" /LENGTH=1109 /DNA_ID=CAMNT_0038781531 /DNA_START=109 /DNA_END=3434 /DNA_ORIENTATION=+
MTGPGSIYNQSSRQRQHQQLAFSQAKSFQLKRIPAHRPHYPKSLLAILLFISLISCAESVTRLPGRPRILIGNDTSGFIGMIKDKDENRSLFRGYDRRLETLPPATKAPTMGPTSLPTAKPIKSPTSSPTQSPTKNPTTSPTKSPTKVPTASPTKLPTLMPTRNPTKAPTRGPTALPTSLPSAKPTREPSAKPTRAPTKNPTSKPSSGPTAQPSSQPTKSPTKSPTKFPTSVPTTKPSISAKPSLSPTQSPTKSPTASPSAKPSYSRQNLEFFLLFQFDDLNEFSGKASTELEQLTSETVESTLEGSHNDDFVVKAFLSFQRGIDFSSMLNDNGRRRKNPTSKPSSGPTGRSSPSFSNVAHPISSSQGYFFHQERAANSTETRWRQGNGRDLQNVDNQCDEKPEEIFFLKLKMGNETTPIFQSCAWLSIRENRATICTDRTDSWNSNITVHPAREVCRVTCETCELPSAAPSNAASITPTNYPTHGPSGTPTASPSALPTQFPSKVPTASPSVLPTQFPSKIPTVSPSALPTQFPSNFPSSTPTVVNSKSPSSSPSKNPSVNPTGSPSLSPSSSLSKNPSTSPTVSLSLSPSALPSKQPSRWPSKIPSLHPSGTPTAQPTLTDSANPSMSPSLLPSSHPSLSPSFLPTAQPSSQPTKSPTKSPTKFPTSVPTTKPSISAKPSLSPTQSPTKSPTASPSAKPSYSRQNLEFFLLFQFDDLNEFSGKASTELEQLTSETVESTLEGSHNDDFVVKAFLSFQRGIDFSSMLNDNGRRRLQTSGLEAGIEIYVQTRSGVTYETESMREVIARAFDTTEERREFFNELQKRDSSFRRINMMEVTIDDKRIMNPNPTKEGLRSWIYIGSGIGAGAVVVASFLFIHFRRRHKLKQENFQVFEGNRGGPTNEVLVNAEDDNDISTMGDPVYGGPTGFFAGASAFGQDEPTNASNELSAGYDYNMAYGGAGDMPSVSSAGGTKSAAGTRALADDLTTDESRIRTHSVDSSRVSYNQEAISMFEDDNSFEQMYGEEERIEVVAPPGKLGVVIDTPLNGSPIVHAIKESSVLADRVRIGDQLISVDGEDTREMTAIRVSKLISSKATNPRRYMVFLRSGS